MSKTIDVVIGDCREVLKTLPEKSVHCCVTSPPYYGLRDYGVEGQIGLEQTPEEYVNELVQVFREVKRVLRDDGTLWLNLGDSYVGGAKKGEHEGTKQKTSKGATWGDNDKLATLKAHVTGLKNKDLIGIPWRVAFALQEDGWYLRQDIIWQKFNPMPESVRDRCTKSHEYIFLLSKSGKYYFDNEAIKEDSVCDHPSGNGYKRSARVTYQNPDGSARGNEEQWKPTGNRNKRSVWQVNTKPYKGAHFACVDDLTEVLTLTGWKCRENLTLDDEIATFDILDEEIHYHKPYEIYEYDYEGELIHIKNQWVDQLVTPNHRVLLKYVHNTNNCKKHFDENWHYINAEDVTTHSGILIPNAGKYTGFLSIGEDKAALLGWIITEGNIAKSGSIQIYQSLSANPQKVATIEELIVKCGMSYSKSDRIRTTPNNKESHEVVFRLNKSQNDLSWIYEYINKDKTPKWDLLHLKANELNALYQALIDGDGHRRLSDGRESFIQKDPHIQSWFRVLCCHLNMRTTLNEKRTRISSCMTSHVTKSNYSQIHQTDFKECVKKEQYKGKVWCPHLPNTNFIAKRGNCIFITGNTFPSKLIEPCIKAGTSENGVCSECGSPYKRVTEVTGQIKQKWGTSDRPNCRPGNENGTGDKGLRNGMVNVKNTVGWKPSCSCNAPSIPATVLDPFGGSGTVGQWCNQNNRNAILIELNPEYKPLIEERINSTPKHKPQKRKVSHVDKLILQQNLTQYFT